MNICDYHAHRRFLYKMYVSILMGNKVLHISFQFMSYDLIDLELDFDEDYYEDMRTNIVNVLVNECKKTNRQLLITLIFTKQLL
jgi:hypothetical protein